METETRDSPGPVGVMLVCAFILLVMLSACSSPVLAQAL